jgi:hypothetical protein
VETLRLSERRPVRWRAEWVVGQEESRVGLLIDRCEVVRADSLSTTTMGVAHFGQRKQAGWAGAKLLRDPGRRPVPGSYGECPGRTAREIAPPIIAVDTRG